MQETLRAMTACEKQFPAGAALIEEAHRALAETFPRVDTVAKKYTSPNQPEGTRKEGTSVLHNVQGTPQGSRRQP